MHDTVSEICCGAILYRNEDLNLSADMARGGYIEKSGSQ